jgi:hypothetical protein
MSNSVQSFAEVRLWREEWLIDKALTKVRRKQYSWLVFGFRVRRLLLRTLPAYRKRL